jgi:hypothetical protein
LPVGHGAALEALEPAGPFVRAMLNEDGVRRRILAQRVVLATGRAGAGGVFCLDLVDRGLVPDLAAHTNDDIDFAALRGKSIAILGAGASAWDNAATALERGAIWGPGFELTEKTPGSDPTLGQIHLVNFGAHAGHAGIASDIPGVNIAADRIASAIVTSPFR